MAAGTRALWADSSRFCRALSRRMRDEPFQTAFNGKTALAAAGVSACQVLKILNLRVGDREKHQMSYVTVGIGDLCGSIQRIAGFEVR